jgi:hypothetical protein
MSRFQKPNSQQAFNIHQQAERMANNVMVSFRSSSKADPLLDINNWPSRSGFSSDGNWYMNGGGALHESVWFEDISTYAIGMRSHYSIVGTTKDSTGTAMAAVTLEAYTTADDVKRGECVSNSGGEYVLPTQTTGNHYVRAYKVGGAYNYGGTSDENLVPV